jgi:hypothetical protein
MNANWKRPKKEAQSSDYFRGLPTNYEKKAVGTCKNSRDGLFRRAVYLQMTAQTPMSLVTDKIFCDFFLQIVQHQRVAVFLRPYASINDWLWPRQRQLPR